MVFLKTKGRETTKHVGLPGEQDVHDIIDRLLNEEKKSLHDVDLEGIDLERIDLSAFKKDVFCVLDEAPNEAPDVLKALQEGRIDGNHYVGECACLMGTIAKLRGVDWDDMKAPKAWMERSAERWFLAIEVGDTPENSQVARITAGWIQEWLDGNKE